VTVTLAAVAEGERDSEMVTEALFAVNPTVAVVAGGDLLTLTVASLPVTATAADAETGETFGPASLAVIVIDGDSAAGLALMEIALVLVQNSHLLGLALPSRATGYLLLGDGRSLVARVGVSGRDVVVHGLHGGGLFDLDAHAGADVTVPHERGGAVLVGGHDPVGGGSHFRLPYGSATLI
jgi:hypothetical protein